MDRPPSKIGLALGLLWLIACFAALSGKLVAPSDQVPIGEWRRTGADHCVLLLTRGEAAIDTAAAPGVTAGFASLLQSVFGPGATSTGDPDPATLVTMHTGLSPARHGIATVDAAGPGNLMTLADRLSRVNYQPYHGVAGSTAPHLLPQALVDDFPLAPAAADRVDGVAALTTWLADRRDATRPPFMWVHLASATRVDAAEGTAGARPDLAAEVDQWVRQLSSRQAQGKLGPMLVALVDLPTGAGAVISDCRMTVLVEPPPANVGPQSITLPIIDVMPTLVELLYLPLPTTLEGYSHARALNDALGR